MIQFFKHRVQARTTCGRTPVATIRTPIKPSTTANIQMWAFSIMLYLTIHLPREARLGGPVAYRYMYPFERYVHVQNRLM